MSATGISNIIISYNYLINLPILSMLNKGNFPWERNLEPRIPIILFAWLYINYLNKARLNIVMISY